MGKDKKVFTVVAESLNKAIHSWGRLVEFEDASSILRITNETIYNGLQCDRCINSYGDGIMGSGYCSTHDMRYSCHNINQPCPACAIEQGLCIDCGTKTINYNTD
jgi:hypothetical protein